MPLKELTEQESVQGMSNLDSELSFLLETRPKGCLPREVRALIEHLGIVSLDQFKTIGKDAEDVRTVVHNDFGLDPAEGMTARLLTAKIVTAWEAAHERVTTRTQVEAQARAEGRTPEVPRQVQISLRMAYEDLRGEVDDNVFPADEYNSDRIQQIEDNYFKAEPLIAVVTYAEAGEEAPDTDYVFSMTQQGRAKFAKVRSRVHPPRDLEELRRRCKTMWLHWEIMKLKHPDRDVMAHLSRESWDGVLDYLLGATVWGYASRSGCRLQWQDLLNYEFEIRRKAFKLVTYKKLTLDDALSAARKDEELRNFHFTLQLVTSSQRARSRSPKPHCRT